MHCAAFRIGARKSFFRLTSLATPRIDERAIECDGNFWRALRGEKVPQSFMRGTNPGFKFDEAFQERRGILKPGAPFLFLAGKFP
jgi:hypothetical protein